MQLTMVMWRVTDLLMANITAKDLGDAAAAPTARGAFSLSAIQVRAKPRVAHSTVCACLYTRAVHDRASWLSTSGIRLFFLWGLATDGSLHLPSPPIICSLVTLDQARDDGREDASARTRMLLMDHNAPDPAASRSVWNRLF